ncbi:hypothetical protein KAFR_0B02830 [Kazachstania africana CBS 2517]|uniref:AB hydrolase-1 domain-containing protein n=1 Tax=Kazachstania africana (strain ATCC 22294 / BCRC 22015 / CBS 2517 / CECT 1963 / NBRC 1671 / NRRL Y-8276) TaxID=1071382 RepID=H2AQD0_KAZAF|nr:hypothetical protein KAFR_0B02830 [Kazachstania africana CBS 2517]CCF56580.1 hypothetical protein KAFR_0B02830 [Kazachstania africana CBS 2517]
MKMLSSIFNTNKVCAAKSETVTMTDIKLKALEEKIMEKVTVPGTKTNQMVNNEINEWHFHNPNASKIKTPTLLIHGYAASSMAFHRTFNRLSTDIKDLYAIDLPGNGLSSAPELSDVIKMKDLKITLNKSKDGFTLKKAIDLEIEKANLAKYENYYLSRIDEWRKFHGIEKLNVIGHSFGGFISFKYAITHPNQVNDLILVSPLGMEKNIHSLNNNFELETKYTLDFENPASLYYARSFNVPSILFNNQLNILRWMGPLGGRMARQYIDMAYKKVPDVAYKNYLYYVFYDGKSFPKVTINNFTNMFSKNLLARDPIMDNLLKLRAKKVMLVYGEHDWMDKYAGYNMVELLSKSNYKLKDTVHYVEIPDAGHNLFLDNPTDFSENVVSFLAE